MSSKNDDDQIEEIYKKTSDKPFGLDKLQPPLKEGGDDFQEALDHIAEITKEIKKDLEEDVKGNVEIVDFTPKKH